MAFGASLDEIVAANANGLLGQHPSWTRVRLGEVARVDNGAAFESARFNVEQRGMPLIRIRDVARGRTETYYDGDYEERYIVRPGDLVIGMDGDFNHALWPSPTALLNQRVCRLAFTDDAPLSRQFVYYALGGYLKAINDATSSVTVKHLSSRTIAEIPLPLPPRKQQDRIVRSIERAFSCIAAGEANLLVAINQTDLMSASLISDLTARGEPQLVGDLLAGVEAGRSFRCHSFSASDEQWGVIKVSAMTSGTFKATENKAVLDESDVDPRWEVKRGDLLVSRANTSAYVGASVLVPECRPRLLLSDKSLRLRPVDGVDPAWLQIALTAPRSRTQMSALATGTSDSMRNLSQDKLRAVKLAVPPLDDQRQVVRTIREQLSSLDVVKGEIDLEIGRISTLKQQVLRVYLLGRLETDAEGGDSEDAWLGVGA